VNAERKSFYYIVKTHLNFLLFMKAKLLKYVKYIYSQQIIGLLKVKVERSKWCDKFKCYCE